MVIDAGRFGSRAHMSRNFGNILGHQRYNFRPDSPGAVRIAVIAKLVSKLQDQDRER